MNYENLIKQMTLEEKASLMSGKDFWQTKNLDKINSDQFVYQNENNKRNQFLNNFFKNRSLSVSIPLQHKRRSTDIIANNEKKVIKHLNIQSN